MMSALFEEILLLGVISVLVALFAWIYLRDRRREFGLWVLGWSAIFIHFVVPVASHLLPIPGPLQLWIKIATLAIAGTAFLLSVSEVFRNRRQRVIFIAMISLTALLYFAGFAANISQTWFYVALLGASIASGLYQAVRFYRLRSMYLYAMAALLLPYGIWSTFQASRGNTVH